MQKLGHGVEGIAAGPPSLRLARGGREPQARPPEADPVTRTLPDEVREPFERFITCEYTTVDARQRPIVWPVTPYYRDGAATVDITTGIGYPKKADDAARNPHVALLFSDPTGCGIDNPPAVLVQGTAQVDDKDLEAIRSHHSEEPEVPPARPEGGATKWDERLDELGRRHRTAVLSMLAPDGFPISCRLPIEADSTAARIRLGKLPDWLLARPGLACLTAHEHHPEFRWQTNFQVRGDLVEDAGAWSLVPHRLIGGFELPESKLEAY